MPGPLARLYATLGLDARVFDETLTRSERVMAGFGTAATAGATAAGFALGGMAADGINAYTQLDTKMREVFTLMPGLSNDAREAMTQDARDFAREFGISTDEAIGGLYNSLSAGVPQDNVFAFMQTAQKAATAGVTDLSSSIGLLSAVTKGYGDTSQEATQKAADLAFTTVKLGQTTFPELAASIGEVVPGAAALGISIEEVNAVFATLTGVTGNASKVTTQFKAIETALISQNADMTRALKEQGYETSKAALETLGFQGTLDLLYDAVDGDTKQLQKMFGSVEALTAFLPLTGAQADKFTSNLDEMGSTAGTVDVAFEEMNNGIEAQGRRFAAFINDLKLTVGKELQAFGPLFYAFGPQMGRWIGRGFGAAFGFVAAQLPRLMAPLIAKMSAVLAGSQAAQAIGGAIGSSLTGGPVMSRLNAIGGRWGKVLGVGAAVAMGAIIVAELDQLNQTARGIGQARDFIREGEAKRDAGDFGVGELRSQLRALETEREKYLSGQNGLVEDLLISFNADGTLSELDKQIEATRSKLADGMREQERTVRQGGVFIEQAVEQAYDPLSSISVPPLPTPEPDVPAIKGSFARMRQAIVQGFGSVKQALENPPQLISREDRIENMEARMKKVMRNLHKAVQADDPINVGYWSKAAVKQQDQLDKMRGKSATSTKDIKAKFDAMGVEIDATWLASKRGAKGQMNQMTTHAGAKAQQIADLFGAIDLTTAGSNLMTTWANGITAALPTVLGSVKTVTDAVAAFLVGESPPPKGPLSRVDRGGANIMHAWGGGMMGERSYLGRVAAAVSGAVSPVASPALAGAVAVGGGAVGGGTHIHVHGNVYGGPAGLRQLAGEMERAQRPTSRQRRLDNLAEG